MGANLAVAGDQAFAVVDAFTHHAGQMLVAYDRKHDVTRISLDTDGDGVADSIIVADGDHRGFAGFVL